MAKECDLYLDKGSDFLINVLCVGLNQEPLDLEGLRFESETCFTQNEQIRQMITCKVDTDNTGYLTLFIPYYETSKMPVGLWHYNIECIYREKKRWQILQGHLYVKSGYSHLC